MTATIHSIPGYGTWDNPASWSEERIPTSDDIVEINGTMAMNVSPTIAGLVINGWGELLGSYSSMVVNGDIENHGTFSVTILTISGTGTHILDFHNNPFIGNIFLEWDISVLGDLNITGSFGLRWTTHNIHLEDGHGITAKAGFINGAIIISGTNTFLKTQWYTHTFTVTGSLDHYIFDTKNTTQLASELYTYCSSISAKSIEITPGSSVYTHPNCLEPRYTFNTEKFSIASGATLNIQQNFQVNWNILNDGTISGSATLFVQGNLENNGDIQWTTNPNISGNISNSSARVSLSTLTISGTGIHILDFHNNSFTGNILIEWDISLIWDLNLAGSLTLGWQTHTVTLENGHGITAKEGVINGTLIVSGSGGFLKTQWYTHTFTVTGSLDRYIFDTKNTVLAPTESYLYRSDISAKNIVITTSSSLYNYPTSENASILNTEKFIISSGSIFDVQRNLQVNWNLLNDGTISGPATLFVQGNIENNNIWTTPTHISWLSTDWAMSYTIRFDPGSSTGFTTTATTYDISDKIWGSYYYQVTPDTQVYQYSELCHDRVKYSPSYSTYNTSISPIRYLSWYLYNLRSHSNPHEYREEYQ
jgi:hypothetical protein